MKRDFAQLLLIGLLFTTAVRAAQKAHYSQGKLMQVEHKTREKVTMYHVNNPLATEVPYYQITVRIDQTDYRAEYTPRHPEEELPDGWVNGADVMVRVDKHQLFLKRPDGSELEWLLLKRSPVKE